MTIKFSFQCVFIVFIHSFIKRINNKRIYIQWHGYKTKDQSNEKSNRKEDKESKNEKQKSIKKNANKKLDCE